MFTIRSIDSYLVISLSPIVMSETVVRLVPNIHLRQRIADSLTLSMNERLRITGVDTLPLLLLCGSILVGLLLYSFTFVLRIVSRTLCYSCVIY